MVANHLSDVEVQQYVVDRQHCEIRIVDHMRLCGDCKLKAEIYQSLVTGITQQAQPTFSFDLSALVVQQLPTPKENASERLLIRLLLCIGIAVIGAGVYFFEGSFVYLFKGVAASLIYRIVITAVTVCIGLFIDMYNKYNNEMKLLDSY